MTRPVAGPVILYELNEVPWRVVDWYVGLKPRSQLAALLPNAGTFTSVTHDDGELHPWTTWPTLHRSVYNTAHNIRFINQDLTDAAAYPPLWEKAAREGLRVGVFGSLQSYPPPADGSYAFYVPDTFAPRADTFPLRYSCFQRLNLRQTKRDGAVASDVQIDGAVINDLMGMLAVGVRMATLSQLGAQLLAERRSPIHRTRRAMLQAPLSFDVFTHALKSTAPDLATFFTNHVAGVMHRYWRAAFPEDFGGDLGELGANASFHRDSLIAAMDIADRQIGWLRRYVDRRGGALVIASSMGQEAVDRGPGGADVRLIDAGALIRAIGFTEPVEDRLAMQPDFNFALQTEASARRFIERLGAVRDLQGNPVYHRLQAIGSTVNCGMGCEAAWVESGKVVVRGPDGDDKVLSFAEAGLKVIRRDVGTGYHQPKGLVIWHGPGQAENSRREIESIEVAPMVLAALGADAVGAHRPH